MNGIAFRLGGVAVRVEVFFIGAMGLLGWLMGRSGVYLVAWIVIAAASVLAHELGHAVAFRRFGAQPEIVLHGFGGYTTGNAQPPGRSVVVSVAGPAVGLIVGAAVLIGAKALGPVSEPMAIVLSDLVFVNLGWGLFNLMPMLPLDGGNVVAAVLAHRGAAPRQAYVVSIATGVLLAVAAIAARQPFIAIMVGYLAMGNVSVLNAQRDEPEMRQLYHARRLLAAGEGEAALATAAEVAEATRSSSVANSAAELQAWALLAGGRPDDARAVVVRCGQAGMSQLLRVSLALATENGLRHQSDQSAKSAPVPVSAVAAAFASSCDAIGPPIAAALVMQGTRLAELVIALERLPSAQATLGLGRLRDGLSAAGFVAESNGIER